VRRRDPFEELSFPHHAGDPHWRPPADIYRTPRGWFIKVDLAGVAAEDLEVGIYGGALVVRGTRRDVHVREGFDPYRIEISHSSFERRFELPCEVGGASLEVRYLDGLLLITLTEN
jgi:HSP20 family protein